MTVSPRSRVRDVCLVATSLLLALAACSGNDDEVDDALSRASVRRQAIQGGMKSKGKQPVVAILSSSGALCTGSLIANNLVLTARHCIADTLQAQEFVDCSTDTFAPASTTQRLLITADDTVSTRSRWFRVASLTVPAASNKLCGYDLALLTLEQPVPSDVTAPTEPRLNSDPNVGENYEARGFGLTSESVSGTAGERLARGGLRVACAVGGCGAQATEFIGDTGVCEGDSGGPALDSQGRVFGVLSRGALNCERPVYTATSRFATFIRNGVSAAAKLPGGEVPSWFAVQGGVEPTATSTATPDPNVPRPFSSQSNDGCQVAASLGTTTGGSGPWLSGSLLFVALSLIARGFLRRNS